MGYFGKAISQKEIPRNPIDGLWRGIPVPLRIALPGQRPLASPADPDSLTEYPWSSLLFLKKGLQGLLRLLGPIQTATQLLVVAPGCIVVAEIGPLFVKDTFGRHFLAFIVSGLVVKIALFTTAQISTAMETCILSPHLSLD